MATSATNAGNTLVGRVEDVLTAMSSGNAEKLREFFAENLVYRLTGQHRFSGTYEGRQSLLDLLAGVAAGFRDGIHYTVDRIIAVDNTVVAAFTGTGTTVNGDEYRNDYCAIWDFDGHRQVIRITEYFDSDHVVKVLT